jgi:hypothetical protein
MPLTMLDVVVIVVMVISAAVSTRRWRIAGIEH